MSKNPVLFNKTLVFGIFILLIGMSVVSSGRYNATVYNLSSINSKMDSRDVLLYENFSGTFPPEGWSTDWWTQCDIGCGIEPPCACLIENQYENNSAYLTSKAVDASEYGKITVTFYLTGSIYPNFCSFFIKIKTNETSPWKDVTPWDNPIGHGWDWGYFEVGIYNCTGGCEALQIKFEYIGYENYYSSFSLDDVEIWGIPSNNSAPEPPIIDGQTSGKPGIEYEYTFKVSSPIGNDVYIWIDWGDASISGWLGPYDSGNLITLKHQWKSKASVIRAKAKDTDNLWGPWGEIDIEVTISEPSKPTIEGPSHGNRGVLYDYKFMSTHPYGDEIWYYVYWGDFTSTGWFGPYNPGTEVTKSHKWIIRGSFIIRAKAKDSYNAESDWSEFEVEIPRNKATTRPLFHWFLERFPLLERLLTLLRVI